MYPKNISFHRRFSQITSVGSFQYTKEDLISKLASVLQSCSHPNPDPQVIHQGQQLHAQIIVNGINHVGLLGSRLLGMYILCNKFIDAKSVFYKLDLVYASPWNWMIRGFTMMGCFDSAILVYFKMLGYGTCPDKYTFRMWLRRVVGWERLGWRNLFIGRFGSWVLRWMLCRDDVLWNVILNGYLKHGDSKHVVLLFNQMRSSDTRPGSVTYACVLSACASDANVNLGTQIHGLLIKCGQVSDPQVLNTLIAVYAKCRWLFDARKLFDSVQEAGSVTWNVIIGGHVQNGLMNEALDLLREMIFVGTKPDTITLASFLPALSESASINHGKEIHCYILRQNVHLDVFLKNALIDMYFKCREVEMARNVFTCSRDIDVVICTAMISGYVLNGMNFDALETFRFLLNKQMKPNAVTLSSSLPACAGLVALKLGKELHGQILKNGLEGRCHVGTAVVDMYAKCGRLDLAHQVFDKMSEKDSVCWNSMITSFCQNGQPRKPLSFSVKWVPKERNTTR
ncbi:putative tetratricopeptide-like helical domain superfamily [Helianthus annuus]|nr:putative tetratricopeptide-like helical domain superfamily [Helianthus annuus]